MLRQPRPIQKYGSQREQFPVYRDHFPDCAPQDYRSPWTHALLHPDHKARDRNGRQRESRETDLVSRPVDAVAGLRDVGPHVGLLHVRADIEILVIPTQFDPGLEPRGCRDSGCADVRKVVRPLRLLPHRFVEATVDRGAFVARVIGHVLLRVRGRE